jgi:hypothetical protein
MAQYQSHQAMLAFRLGCGTDLSHTVMMTVSMQLIIVIPQMLSFDRVALSGYIQYFSQKV